MEEDGYDRSQHGDDRRRLYRHGSNQSSSTIFEDVEMAQDELYSGPMAESLPSSVSAFPHRRARANSQASFSFYQEEDGELRLAMGDMGSIEDVNELPFEDDEEEDESFIDLERQASENDSVFRRRPSTPSQNSVHSRLLRRDSGASGGSGRVGHRMSQKIYMASEDLYIVIAGFRTNAFGDAAYIMLCICTLGLGWLLFRWLPRLHVKLVGQPSQLRHCKWVVVENQWNEMAILKVGVKPYGRPLSSVFGVSREKITYASEEDDDPIIEELRALDYRHVPFFYHPLKDKFLISAGWKDPQWTDVRSVRIGINSDEKNRRDYVFGYNLIDIEQKSISRLLVDEVFHPFYVFQIASLILWSLDEYYYYAFAIFTMSAVSIVTELVETRSSIRRLRDMSRFICEVRVLRDGFWRTLPSSDLSPGDVYEVSDPGLSQFPADSLLLSGDCIVNESMLTGESVPVSKTPATDQTLQDLDLAASTAVAEIARHFLYCGTKIIRARRPQDQGEEAVALALVVRTGFNTTKGALVRSMLFPKPSGFKFYRDSFRYISVMACVAILGFIVSVVNFLRLHMHWHVIFIRAVDLITIVVPPALPATLTIGTSFSLARLKKKQIFCISPQRVNVGGKLDMMCFDKTGTLTEEGLDIHGVRAVSRATGRFEDTLNSPDALSPGGDPGSPSRGAPDTREALLHTMATCHSLRSVDDELVGDPLDLKMFDFTRWSFEEGSQGGGNDDDEQQGTLRPSVAKPPVNMHRKPNGHGHDADVPFELGVLKSFEFMSHLRRASVIVRAFGQQRGDIYVKGAPECMRDICRPESFPSDYDHWLSYYTHKGYRVIGCATKHFNRLTWVKAQKMKREQVESELDFVGFIIFENKLKPTTTPVLRELIAANIGCVMVTGDNILTAISVARECNMISKTAHCFVPRFVAGHSRLPTSQLQWESIDNPLYQLNDRTLLPLPTPVEADASLPYDISNLRNYSIAVSGDVFRWIVDYASPQVMQRMLVVGKVFARMSPDEKHELVEKLQSIGYCCGFCGDGANDCGALKAADVGISLSEAEASVAAPFTSRIFDISCVPEVIREGRAALVTSFSCFKYMTLYSAIQFTSVSFLYASASNLGDSEFLFIDLVLILPIAVFMSWAGPFPELSSKRPTADLVSRKVLTPLLSHMVICILVQTVVFVTVRQQPWFIPPLFSPMRPHIKNSENTALFLTSCFEYTFAGVVLNAGMPFREPALKNRPFLLTMIIAASFSIYMTLSPPSWLSNLMELSRMSLGFRGFIVSLGFAYVALAWLGEIYVFPHMARAIGRAKQAITRRPKKRKEYKVILDKMMF